MESQSFATKDEFWRLQETLTELSATQAQYSDRISRLEKKMDDGVRTRNVWGPSSPFPSAVGSSQHESTLNPAAEAFRNFDADPSTALISSLTLDSNDDPRRAAASRANSVRFDESANNHYGPSRQSIDLPTRTGSGLGSHPLSERSLSHRSDGRGSNSGFTRTNSFGLESSRLLGSIHNSPRVSGNPPPGFFVLGPCPSIIRCWLTETFSNGSLLYAAVCTGSSLSTVGMPLLQKLGLADQVVEEGGFLKIKLPVYLTEAKIQYPSSRSASPAPQVPTLIAKFVVVDRVAEDKSIQIILGSDILRSHSADILFSQDKLSIFDEDRNQLSVPLVRPEDDEVYKSLSTGSRHVNAPGDMGIMRPPAVSGEQFVPGVIGRPGRGGTKATPAESPVLRSPNMTASTVPSEAEELRGSELPDATPRSSTELGQARPNEVSTTGSEKPYSTPTSKTSSSVWGNSWRSTSTQADSQTFSKPSSSYSKPMTARPMKVLRPTKSLTGASRSASSSTPFSTGPENTPPARPDPERGDSQGDAKGSGPVSTKSNPVGSASAFGWLNSGQQRRTTASGS